VSGPRRAVLVAHDWRAGLAAIALVAAAASAGAAQEFQVVVHPSVQGTKITRANLSALFTGRTSSWGDKVPVKPVDQSAKAPIRRAFTVSVIGLSMGELQMYWQRRVSADHVFPPPTKGSDEEILRYVAATAGAIGYIGPETTIPETVKALAVVD
jgi:ABC-type phosphate transport system substrate-binding protein